MKFKIIVLLALLLGFIPNKTVKCSIETTQGDIIIELYPEKAPITVANFLKYVDDELYSNTTFFRTTTLANEADREHKIEVIQGGYIAEEKSFPAIQMETTDNTGIKHLDGVLSMARNSPNTATSSFFICINDQPALNFAGKRNPDGYGFAAFGRVIKGMDIVTKIHTQENKNQILLEPVLIKSIKRIN